MMDVAGPRANAMTALREPAPAKVNLCLFVGPVRPDGRHELVTLFESISLADELELSVLQSGQDEVVCPDVPGPNLAAAALAALRHAGWSAPPVRIEIHKRIPVAAGLGGGSADAAAMLRMAHAWRRWQTDGRSGSPASSDADVPSQLAPGLSLALVRATSLRRSCRWHRTRSVILPQPFGLSTAEVYRETDRLGLPVVPRTSPSAARRLKSR